MNKKHSIARERFSINSVGKETRFGITVTAQDQDNSIATLLAEQFKARNISIDMFVLHRRGKTVTASLVLDKPSEDGFKHLTEIAAGIKRAVGQESSVLIHNAVVKLTIQGYGLCTSPRTSSEVFDKIRRAGQNIEMMSISENEISLVFQQSCELTRFFDGFLKK